MLVDVCEINPGKKELSELRDNTEVSFLPMAAVSVEGEILKQDKRKLKEVIKGFTYFRDEDVLVAKITPCFENGKRAIARNLLNGVGFGSTEFHVLRAKEKVIPRWIFYAISKDDFRNIAISRMTGTAGQKRVPKKVLEEYEIPIPDKQEQEQISDTIETQFTRLDSAIKSLKAIKDKLGVYRESVLKKAFTTGFSENCNFKLLQLDDIKGDGKHAIKRGPFGSAIKKSFFVKSGYKVYEQKHAIYNDFSLGHYYINKEKFQELKAFEVKSGDLIISCSGTIGRIAVAPPKIEQGVINQALLKITLNNEVILTTYFIYLFQSRYLQYEVTKNTRGTAIKNISSVKDLKQIDFPVPSLEEQERIVGEIESRFSVIDKLEEVVDTSLLKAERLRRSILKAAFEGKLVN